MSLWGNKDSVYSDGTIAVNLATKVVTGTGVTFNTAGLIAAGDVITVGTGATFGYAVISEVLSGTTISIANTSNIVSGVTTVPAGAAYNISQEPLYTLGDSTYRAPESKSTGYSVNPVFTGVFGVDPTEQGVANAAAGRKFAAPHAGWVGVTTYNDNQGNLRVKTETLVAGSTITTDASDDVQYPDT